MSFTPSPTPTPTRNSRVSFTPSPSPSSSTPSHSRLDRLELENFKSYSGRHTVPFTNFTAIIGPNGAG